MVQIQNRKNEEVLETNIEGYETNSTVDCEESVESEDASNCLELNIRAEKGRSLISGVVQFLISVMVGSFLGWFLTTYVITLGTVHQSSMLPTYSEGDKVLICKILEPKRGDIVVVDIGGNYLLIKRLIGVPGETVEMKEGYVYIDDVLLKENIFENEGYDRGLVSSESITLDKEEYFILGDNRENSMDSSEFGAVNKSQIVGVVVNYERIFG